jgi:hypothetical protein
LGASWEEIIRFPSRSVQRHQVMCLSNCFQCSKAFKERDSIRTLPCQHSFHTRCIDPWLFQQAECPMCKNPILTLEI